MASLISTKIKMGRSTAAAFPSTCRASATQPSSSDYLTAVGVHNRFHGHEVRQPRGEPIGLLGAVSPLLAVSDSSQASLLASGPCP